MILVHENIVIRHNWNIECWFSRFGIFVLYFKMAAIQEISIFEE